MRKIKKLIDNINEEIEGAKNYAEIYLEMKAKGEQLASKFKSMADDEIRHAMIIHDYTLQEIDTLKRVYTPPSEMLEIWDKEHVKYVEKVAWIKKMLEM